MLLSVCGYIVGRDHRWEYFWVLTGYVGGLLLALYVAAMLMAPTPAGSDNDTAAGAGVVIIGVPVLCVVAAFVGPGAGASLLVERLVRRRTQSLMP